MINLDTISEEDLLKCRICDLPIQISGTWLEECIQQLYKELDDKGIVFKPECYLADEWLTPEREPVIGIPFYLAHPVLTRLEKKMMLEAEGETKEWCMQLLRHETGHALCYAFKLNRQKKWRDTFGSSSKEYGDTYRFRPYSRNFVRHLDGYYAQYHPDEDFVETFAVWLTPNSGWDVKYQGWKALHKLQYVDKLMMSLRGKPPLAAKGKKYWHQKKLHITLEHFYKKKHKLREEDFPDFHDGHLLRIFVQEGLPAQPVKAEEMIRKYRATLLKDISHWTGERRYVVNDLLKTISKRCRELKLFATDSEPVIAAKLSAYITTRVMNYLYTGWYRGDPRRRK